MERLINVISGVLAAEKVKRADAIASVIVEALQDYLPKSGSRGGNKPYVENGVTYIWCSRHQEYHASEYMVPNSSKECGFANYCRAAQAKWEWMHKHSQKLTSLAAPAFIEGNTEKATALHQMGVYLSKAKNDQPNEYKSVAAGDDPKEVVAKYRESVYKPLMKYLSDEDKKVLGFKKA